MNCDYMEEKVNNQFDNKEKPRLHFLIFLCFREVIAKNQYYFTITLAT